MLKQIFCDESCHLLNDDSDVMVLGGIVCSIEHKEEINTNIRALKKKHGISIYNEIKWTKVSTSKLEFYKELTTYFFEENRLNFRGLVVKEKSKLDHNKYNNSDHNEWYYKMYYYLLRQLLRNPSNQYKIFLDVKDTNGGERTRELHRVLCNKFKDFDKERIIDIQQVNSQRNDILQVTDLLIGALSYYHRGLESENTAKYKLIEHIKLYVPTSFDGTLPSEDKFNVFIWLPRM